MIAIVKHCVRIAPLVFATLTTRVALAVPLERTPERQPRPPAEVCGEPLRCEPDAGEPSYEPGDNISSTFHTAGITPGPWSLAREPSTPPAATTAEDGPPPA